MDELKNINKTNKQNLVKQKDIFINILETTLNIYFKGKAQKNVSRNFEDFQLELNTVDGNNIKVDDNL